MRNPCNIKEGNMEYSLGEFDGKEAVYSFSKIWIYLEAKGKLLFGKDFKLYNEDRELIFKLSNYFIREEAYCKKFGIDPDKGILLVGPVGSGKTSLMRLLKYIVPYQRPYEVIPSRNIVFGFNHVGYSLIESYGSHGFYCFDDLGIEPAGRYFGKDCNVIGEILLSRHELLKKHKIKTHATTNLNATELEDRYGNRVRSRMKELFNLVAFPKRTTDKRAMAGNARG
ncbi:P-loop NTPase family protein [Sinomicrobium oceani]|uniref:ATPase n=1 Tax=Sinomicrobium oceani TaxID=1150368 RepID=UPI00227A2F36|nr:ATPase [Sinomicrobium oceani]